MARSPLWDNPDFLADCRSDMRKKDVMEKWGVSSGLVVDVRHGGRNRPAETGGTLVSVRGEGETHDADGTSSYVRQSDEPWGEDDFRAFLKDRGTDPDSVTYTWGWTSNPAGGVWNKLNNVRPKVGVGTTDAYPLSEFYKELKKGTKVHITPNGNYSARSTVIVIADWQVGKTGRRGGTPELLERLQEARDLVHNELEMRQPQGILILDAGDGIENFESGGNPMFTNDLSLPDQLDCYSTELLKFVRLADQYADTEVGIVSSNHSAWRRGKQQLGRPSDDFGIHVHKQVAKHFPDITWHYPDEWDESLCVDFCGTPIGLVHGNQFSPGKAIDWWQGQAFGNQAITRADVMISGHYHSFGAGVAGQNPVTGRERMWLGAPTLDSGSDWYRNIKGRDSLPGTMIFDVTENGFDLGSLKIL